MNFSKNESSVRLDVFKMSGKWYDTFAIDMNEFYNEPVVGDAVKKAIIKHTVYEPACNEKEISLIGVVLQPYHENAFPQLVYLKYK